MKHSTGKIEWGVASPFCAAVCCVFICLAAPACAGERSWTASVENADALSNKIQPSAVELPKTKKVSSDASTIGLFGKNKGRKTEAPAKKGVPVRLQNGAIETGSIETPEAKVSTKPAPATAAPIAAPPYIDASDPARDKTSTAGRFCNNIKGQLEEAKVAQQKKQLAVIEAEVEKRIALLEAKIVDYKQWLARRQDFSNKAQETLIKIYAKMKPESAAQQLAVIDLETAAAVMLKLDSRAAGEILNNMEPRLAATLAATIAGAAKIDIPPPPQPALPP